MSDDKIVQLYALALRQEDKQLTQKARDGIADILIDMLNAIESLASRKATLENALKMVRNDIATSKARIVFQDSLGLIPTLDAIDAVLEDKGCRCKDGLIPAPAGSTSISDIYVHKETGKRKLGVEIAGLGILEQYGPAMRPCPTCTEKGGEDE